MSDVIYVLLTLGVFMLFALLVGLLDRLLGTDPDSQQVGSAVEADATAAGDGGVLTQRRTS